MEKLVLFQDGLVLFFDSFFIEIHIAILLALIIVATAHDIQSRRIPNSIVFPGALVAILYHALSPYGLGMFSSLQGLAVGLLALMPLYVLRAMGAGDVKMMAMVGAFLGPASAFGAVLTTLLAGGILSVGAAIWKKSLLTTLENTRFIVFDAFISTLTRTPTKADLSSLSKVRLPYAVAIATGTIVHLFLAHAGMALVS